MDVTFFENQPYYPKYDIQGEHTTQEYQFWETKITSSNIQTLESHIPQYHIPHSLSLPITESLDTTVEPPRTSSIHSQPIKNSEFIVYSRKKTQEEIKQRTLPEQVHQAEPNSNPSEISPGNTNFNHVHNELKNDDLNLPIVKRKGVQSCTNHPIYNFLSYDGLPPVFRAFATSLANV